MINKCLFFLGLLSAVSGQSGLDMLSMSIPGEPGVDYPIYASVQDTGFSCEDKVFGGYYADPAMECQGYHVCLDDPIAGSTYPVSFLCPNGTIFQQKIFNCDWWYNVDCSEAESYYSLAINAFASNPGEDGRAGVPGTCPAVQPFSQEECEGTFSTCWSPGFTDTDCPNFGLCCFDGCQDTCIDEAQSQSGSNINPTAQVTVRPTTRAPTRPPTRPTTRPTRRTTQARPTPVSITRPTARPIQTRPTSRPTPRPTTSFKPIFEAVEEEEEEEEQGYYYSTPKNKLTYPTKSTTPANGLYQPPRI